MIVTPHLGGRRIRIRLSNRFGTTPVTLDRVTVAAQHLGAALASPSRPVRFRRRRVVSIPAGGEVVSDTLRFPVQAFANVAIGIHVAGDVGAVTEHASLRPTTWTTAAGSGDHSRDRDGAAFVQQAGAPFTTGWYFLAGLDVRAASRVGAVVAFGDSITDGFVGHGADASPGRIEAGGGYPDALARRLVAASRPLSVLNAGIGGNRILQDGLVPSFGPSGLSRLQRDVLDEPGASDVVVLEGINDIGQSRASARDVIDGLARIAEAVHAVGLRIVLGTLTPAGGSIAPTYGGAAANEIRATVNRWIRTQTVADGVADFDAAVRDADDPSRLAARYDSGDHLHPSPAGYEAMAAAVDLALLRGPGCRPPRRSTPQVGHSADRVD